MPPFVPGLVGVSVLLIVTEREGCVEAFASLCLRASLASSVHISTVSGTLLVGVEAPLVYTSMEVAAAVLFVA